MTTRRIVLDANILIRAVLGTRVPELIEQYGEGTSFFSPDLAFAEAARHLPLIASKRDTDPLPLLASLDRLRVVVEAVPADVIAPLEAVAMARIGRRDPDELAHRRGRARPGLPDLDRGQGLLRRGHPHLDE